jgi:hypothetical protein
MVKVLKNGVGPDWWIEEPLTEQEQRIEAARKAEYAREIIGANIEVLRAGLEADIAADPVPPVTRAERAAFNKEYPPRNKLQCSPEEWDRETKAIWRDLSRATSITFHNGAPHHPIPAARTSSAQHPAASGAEQSAGPPLAAKSGRGS